MVPAFASLLGIGRKTTARLRNDPGEKVVTQLRGIQPFGWRIHFEMLAMCGRHGFNRPNAVIMKSIRSSLLLASFTMGCAVHAAPVMQTFEGVTVSQPAGLAAEYPAGTPWTLNVEWDDAATANSSDPQAANYPLVTLTLILDGQSGPWTTTSVVDAASFTLFQGTGYHEVQFTSGAGAADHTIMTIGGFDVFSINLTLTDRTETAIPALTPIPVAPYDLANFSQRFSDSYLSFYLNGGSESIQGGLGDAPVLDPGIVVKEKGKTLTSGASALEFKPTKVLDRGTTKILSVENTGAGNLTGLAATVTGPARRDFKATVDGSGTVAPGTTKTVRVTFRPKRPGKRSATLQIRSNDPATPTFQLRVQGKAKARKKN